MQTGAGLMEPHGSPSRGTPARPVGEAATWAPVSAWASIFFLISGPPFSPHSQCPSPEPPPVPPSSPFSVTPKIPRKAEPSEQFPPWSVQEQ